MKKHPKFVKAVAWLVIGFFGLVEFLDYVVRHAHDEFPGGAWVFVLAALATFGWFIILKWAFDNR